MCSEKSDSIQLSMALGNLFEDFKDIEGVYNEITNAVEDIVNCVRIHIIANKLPAFS